MAFNMACVWLLPRPDKEAEEVEKEAHREPKFALFLGVKEEKDRGSEGKEEKDKGGMPEGAGKWDRIGR